MSKKITVENRRYIGSKAKLRDWIISTIKKECGAHNSFADIFAGTGSVSVGAMEDFNELIINDILYSNNVCYEAFWGKGKYSNTKISNFIEKYNNLNPNDIKLNYFSKNFGGKYFSKDVAKIIGYIREDIEINRKKLTKKEYLILLASLIYSTDKVANTVGHYDAYIKKEPIKKTFQVDTITPFDFKNVSIYKEDANTLVRKIEADVVYVDPPYNSRQYSRFYHLLENLTKWETPELFGTALKPDTENTSDYCKVKAPEVFANLIKDLKCKYIVVSYNNTYNPKSNSSKNKITLEEIEDTLNSKGKTKVFKKDHKYFNAGNTNFDNHQEFLFITKVYG
ncbi:MAG: DNA adenine methylase [bacterium]|nr:DNA adenine methylase [bacterium]